jgi:hypothetical protein
MENLFDINLFVHRYMVYGIWYTHVMNEVKLLYLRPYQLYNTIPIWLYIYTYITYVHVHNNFP